MGSGKHLMISATGFPGTNETWRFIQKAWREPLEALALLAGNKAILTGVVITGTTASNGYISYNGEILPFVGGTIETNITLIETIVNVTYDVDLNGDSVLDDLPGYKTRYLKFGTDGIDTFPFSDLVLLKTVQELSSFTLPANIVIDANYVHTDVNFTLGLLNKLNGIEDNAQVNVQADWNVINASSDAFIKNKPNLPIVLYKGMSYLGDFPNAQTQTVYINFPNVGTSNYIVVGSMHSFRPYNDAGQDLITWSTAGYTNTNFRLLALEHFGGSQMLRFEYMLIQL